MASWGKFYKPEHDTVETLASGNKGNPSLSQAASWLAASRWRWHFTLWGQAEMEEELTNWHQSERIQRYIIKNVFLLKVYPCQMTPEAQLIANKITLCSYQGSLFLTYQLLDTSYLFLALIILLWKEKIGLNEDLYWEDLMYFSGSDPHPQEARIGIIRKKCGIKKQR